MINPKYIFNESENIVIESGKEKRCVGLNPDSDEVGISMKGERFNFKANDNYLFPYSTVKRIMMNLERSHQIHIDLLLRDLKK